jgi:enoyl-CoA hydratase/carnithine racemase
MEMPSLPDCLLWERPSVGVSLLRINRPEVRNALNLQLRRALADAFRFLASDDRTNVIVLTGDAKAFCAGADLTEYVDATPADIIERDMPGLWRAVADCRKPVIAAVNGYAIGGGCELAMHADIIVAGRSARFAQPEIAIGITPGGGATQRLTRAVGKFSAMRMMLTGDLIDAETARAIGLVSDLVDDTDVLSQALKIAGKIAAMPTVVARQVKQLVLDSMNVPLDAGLRMEMTAFQLSFASNEKTQRMRAFLDGHQAKAKR